MFSSTTLPQQSRLFLSPALAVTLKLPRLLWCGVVKENGGQGSLGRERLVASIDEDTKDTKDIFLISKQRYRGYQSNIRGETKQEDLDALYRE